MKGKVLKKSFFERGTVLVSEELIGKYLVRERRGEKEAFMITEVEAYVGQKDYAAHPHHGRTARTDVMFGDAGVWYVYFIYGMYEMLNIVTGKVGTPHAILIRGVEGISGPGRLTKKLGITRGFNKRDAIPKNGLWIEDWGVKIPKSHVARLPRVGVSYAGDVWAKKPYRFVYRP